MSIKEQAVDELKTLSEAKFKDVSKYDEGQLAALYAEFADKDCNLAEEGMADYVASLTEEDVR